VITITFTAKWSGDHLPSVDREVSAVLAILEDLDGCIFERAESSSANLLDNLYLKLFGGASGSGGNSSSSSGGGHSGRHDSVDELTVVHTLCQWAVTVKRSGEHRAFIVAKLLERRQTAVTPAPSQPQPSLPPPPPAPTSSGPSHEPPSTGTKQDQHSTPPEYLGPPHFQDLLFRFLDQSAPTMDSPREFANLVLLFHELIYHNVFSHDAYLCHLIARGDMSGDGVVGLAGNKGSTGAGGSQTKEDDPNGSCEDRKINDDLANLLTQIKEGNQLEDATPFSPPKALKGGAEVSSPLSEVAKCPRHVQYVYHFPLPLEDEEEPTVASSAAETDVKVNGGSSAEQTPAVNADSGGSGGHELSHESNQRLTVLYGTGKGREDTAKAVRRLQKDVMKLFGKRTSIDVTDGGKMKWMSAGAMGGTRGHADEGRLDDMAGRFRTLSHFDQHRVAHACGTTFLEMLSAFAAGSSSLLPVPEHVSFLLDLAGISVSVRMALDWCLCILQDLPSIEAQLVERGSCLTRNYTTAMALYVVSILRRYEYRRVRPDCPRNALASNSRTVLMFRYHTVVMLNPADVTLVFDQLCKVANRPKASLASNEANPSRRGMLDCNSAEWCILAYLYDLSQNCTFLRSKDKFADLKCVLSFSAIGA
jgi:mediator of RNA polymerase II transcription subunit 12